MTVRELIAALEREDGDAIVMLQEDAEGNGYSPCAGAEAATYVAESTWSGQCYQPELTDEMREEGYTEEDVRAVGPGVIAAVVLWPIN